MIHLKFFACLLVLVLATGPSLAQSSAQIATASEADENKPFWETEKIPDKLVKRYKRRLPFFEKIDRNKDWFLDEQEIELYLLRNFRHFDGDKNGIWGHNELKQHAKVFVEDRAEEYGSFIDDRIKRYKLRLDQADKDENGHLTWEEYYRFYRDRFYRMDQNDDKVVEYREFRTIDDKLSPRGGVSDHKIEVPEYK